MIQESEHTEGPWRVEPDDPRWVLGYNDEMIFTALGYDGHSKLSSPLGDKSLRANAHLIAAAPELLEALELCLVSAKMIKLMLFAK